MTEQSPAQQWQALATQARELARTGTPREVAEGLRAVIFEVYSSTKYDRPGGEGPDGLAGPERDSMAAVHDAAENHFFAMLNANR